VRDDELPPRTSARGNIVIVGTVCCGVDDEDQLSAVQSVVDSFSFDATTDKS